MTATADATRRRFARFASGFAASLALAVAVAAAPVDDAAAGSTERAIAAGVVGLAAGAIVGGALASRERRVIIYDTAPARAGLRPWTPAWYAHCARKYRSFDAETGHYLGYDGRYHFCR